MLCIASVPWGELHRQVHVFEVNSELPFGPVIAACEQWIANRELIVGRWQMRLRLVKEVLYATDIVWSVLFTCQLLNCFDLIALNKWLISMCGCWEPTTQYRYIIETELYGDTTAGRSTQNKTEFEGKEPWMLQLSCHFSSS